jgi:hypothetical protein
LPRKASPATFQPLQPSARRRRFDSSTNPAIVAASINPGGRYGRRETGSGTDDSRDQQRRRRDKGSRENGRQEGQKGGQESCQKGDAEEESGEEIQRKKGRQKILKEILSKEISQEGRQEEKEGQEVKALNGIFLATFPATHAPGRDPGVELCRARKALWAKPGGFLLVCQ